MIFSGYTIDIMKSHRYPEALPDRHTEQAGSTEKKQASSRLADKKLTFSKRLFLGVLFGLLIAGLFVGWYQRASHVSLVPKNIQKSVDFPIYYPESLPAGYNLDTQSFRLAEAGVVLFAVTYDKGKDIVFSEQQQPSASEMDKFISSYVPLNSALQFPLGQAKVGAYGSAPNIRTVVSLPVRNGPWLIATAPSEVSHDDLVKILTSLTK